MHMEAGDQKLTPSMSEPTSSSSASRPNNNHTHTQLSTNANRFNQEPMYDNFLVDVGEIDADAAIGLGYQETGSSEEYIDDYYAASSMNTNMQQRARSLRLQQQQHHHQQLQQQQVEQILLPTQLEIIREQPNSMTSAHPSSISSSDGQNTNSSKHQQQQLQLRQQQQYDNASVNIAMAGQLQYSPTNNQGESSTTQHSQDTVAQQSLSFNGMSTMMGPGSGLDAIGSGLLAQPGAAAVPFYGQMQMPLSSLMSAVSQPGSQIAAIQQTTTAPITHITNQQTNLSNAAPAASSTDEHLLSAAQHSQQLQQQQQPSQKLPATKQPKRKRKINDDYGIYYQYTCDSDSSQNAQSSQTTSPQNTNHTGNNQEQQMNSQLAPSQQAQPILAHPQNNKQLAQEPMLLQQSTHHKVLSTLSPTQVQVKHSPTRIAAKSLSPTPTASMNETANSHHKNLKGHHQAAMSNSSQKKNSDIQVVQSSQIASHAQALEQTGFTSLAALRSAAAKARSSASQHQMQIQQQLQQVANGISTSQKISHDRQKATDQMNLQVLGRSNEGQQSKEDVQRFNSGRGALCIPNEAGYLVAPPSRDQFQDNHDNSHVQNQMKKQQIFSPRHGQSDHHTGTTFQRNLLHKPVTQQKLVGRNALTNLNMMNANTIVPPNATLSSGQKFAEDKSFRHDFYSMDQNEANEQLGANPISLGMDGDLQQTMTQTGLEALIEDDLSMDMVMSRVDWIIQLRDIFYSLLDSTQSRQNGKIRADKLMKYLISMQNSLKLVPKDEYAISSQRHEVCVSYGTILRNLRERILEHQRQTSLVFQLSKQNMSNHSNHLENSLLLNAGAGLMLQMDEVIDFPFKRNSIGSKILETNMNTGPRRFELSCDHTGDQLGRSVENKLMTYQTQLNLNVTTSSKPLGTLKEAASRVSITPLEKCQEDSRSQFAERKPSRRTSTPQIHIKTEKLINQKIINSCSGDPGNKLSSIESRPSSSEADLVVPNSLDESRQQVYGTKTRRGSKPTRSISSKRSKKTKKTPQPLTKGINCLGDKSASVGLMSEKQPTTTMNFSLAVQNRRSSEAQKRKQSISKGGKITADLLSKKLPPSHYNQNSQNKNQLKDGKSNGRRFSQALPERLIGNVKEISQRMTTQGTLSQSDAPVSHTQGDSQAQQMLSIDAFKYATQSPPLSMVTKTLINNKLTQQQDGLQHPHFNLLCDLNNEECNADEQRCAVDEQLEKTRQILTSNADETDAERDDKINSEAVAEGEAVAMPHPTSRPQSPPPHPSVQDQISLSDTKQVKQRTGINVLQLLTPERAKGDSKTGLRRNTTQYSASETKEAALSQPIDASYARENQASSRQFQQQLTNHTPSNHNQGELQQQQGKRILFFNQNKAAAMLSSPKRKKKLMLASAMGFNISNNPKQIQQKTSHSSHDATSSPKLRILSQQIITTTNNNQWADSVQRVAVVEMLPRKASLHLKNKKSSRSPNKAAADAAGVVGEHDDRRPSNSNNVNNNGQRLECVMSRSSGNGGGIFEESPILTSNTEGNNNHQCYQDNDNDVSVKQAKSPPAQKHQLQQNIFLDQKEDRRSSLGATDSELEFPAPITPDQHLELLEKVAHKHNNTKRYQSPFPDAEKITKLQKVNSDGFSSDQQYSPVHSIRQILQSSDSCHAANKEMPQVALMMGHVPSHIDNRLSQNMQELQHKHQQSQQATSKIKSSMPNKKLVVSSDAANKAVTMKCSTNFHKIPPTTTTTSSQVSQSKKRLLRILSPNHRETTTKLFSKEVTPLYSTKNIKSNRGTNLLTGTTAVQMMTSSKGGESQQTCKLSQLSYKDSEKKLVKIKRVNVAKIATTNGPRKPGIKQIQMVYLNPSYGSSRRSPSIPSQRSTSKHSEKMISSANENVKGTGINNLFDHLQENSIQKAYGGANKIANKHQQTNKTSQSAAINRNKSISNCQSNKRSRLLSPKTKVTPRFDSYETLPKHGEQLLKQSCGFFPKSTGGAQLVQSSLVTDHQQQRFNKTQNLSSQGGSQHISKLSDFNAQNRSNKNSESFHNSKQSGVSQGLNSFNPNTLKISLPANTSPLKLSSKQQAIETVVSAFVSPTAGNDKKRKSTTPLIKGNAHHHSTAAQNNVFRVKFKNKNNKHNLLTYTDSSMQPQNNSTESEMTSSLSKFKISKVKVMQGTTTKSQSKQVSQPITRDVSHERSFGIQHKASGLQDPLAQSSSSNTFQLSVKNIHQSQVVLQQQQTTRAGVHQKSTQTSNGRKTPLKSSQQHHQLHHMIKGTTTGQRLKSNSVHKVTTTTTTTTKTAISQQATPFYTQNNNTSQSMKQMTLSQNASTLLQNLQLKNKRSILNQKSHAMTAQQTRKLKIMANLTATTAAVKGHQHHQKTNTNNNNNNNFQQQQLSQQLDSNFSRLFITTNTNKNTTTTTAHNNNANTQGKQQHHRQQMMQQLQQQDASSQPERQLYDADEDDVGKDDEETFREQKYHKQLIMFDNDSKHSQHQQLSQQAQRIMKIANSHTVDENCEALVASEKLPNEPIMPRSHKSSARSFLRNIGHFGAASMASASSTTQNNNTNNNQHQQSQSNKSFLNNVSHTTNSKQTSSTQGGQNNKINSSSGCIQKPPLK